MNFQNVSNRASRALRIEILFEVSSVFQQIAIIIESWHEAQLWLLQQLHFQLYLNSQRQFIALSLTLANAEQEVCVLPSLGPLPRSGFVTREHSST